MQKPDAAKRPASPRSEAEFAKGSAITLRPPATGEAPRMVGGAQQQNLGCTPYISGGISKTGLNVRIDYVAEIDCNFYLAGAGRASLVERTSGSPYNGQTVAAAAPFSFVNGHSYSAWNIGRFYPDYAVYEFDWSTDLCTWAPDNPLGFTFESACARHDFGYRNYKAAQRFEANKARIDLAFYGDLQRVCATYPGAVQPACYALATVYYEAVRNFGRQQVTPEQIDEAAELLPDATPDKAPLT